MKNTWNDICRKGASLVLTLSLAAAVFAGSGGAALAKEAPHSQQAAAMQENSITGGEIPEDLIDQILGMGAVAEEGTVLDFETVDLDGNAVRSQDLFKDHKVTMVNFWATWCVYCVEEMPALEELSKELADKDCQIVGVCLDADESAALAKQILNEKGVTYTNIAASEELLEQVPVSSVPVTYFVDSEGKILTEPVNGADFQMYSEKLAEALEKAGE